MYEHRSTTPDDQMPLRLLEYNTATIRKHHKQDKGGFPVIVNIVLYHGKRPWHYSTAFTDYYANPALGKEYLYMALVTLVNIPQLPTKEIYQDCELGCCFTAFRCTSEPDPYQVFKSTMQKLRLKQILIRYQERYATMLAYIGKCIECKKYSLEDLASNNEQEKEKIMTSIAHEFLQEGETIGIRKGRQEGIREEKLHIARNLLSKLHLDMQSVSEATGLSQEALMKLQEEEKGKE